MQIDSAGNKFSQAKNFSIHQADPEKKNVLRGRGAGLQKPPVFFTSHLHVIQLIHLVTDGHALLVVSEVLKSSAFCYAIVILKRNKEKMNSSHYNWQSAFNITPRADVTYPVTSTVRAEN